MFQPSLNKILRVTLGVLVIMVLGPSSAKGQDAERPLRIGVASIITPVDAVKYYQEIVDYISTKAGLPAQMVHRRTYEEMDRLLELKEVDAAFICSASYILDKRDFGVELLAVPQVNGVTWYKSYVIVHEDSLIRSFDELKDRTFAFTDPKSNSGRLYPEYRLLASKGLKPEQFFQRYVYSFSHNKSIELVAKKIVDGAAVDSLVYEYMAKKGSPYISQVKVVEESPEFGSPPVVVPSNVSKEFKDKLSAVLLKMHEDPKGEQILKAMLIDRFVQAPDSHYDSIREMEAALAKFNPVAGDGSGNGKSVNFAVLPRDNPRIAFEKYQPLIDYLTDTTPLKYNLVIKKTYEATVNALGSGEVDIALLDPLTYLEARSQFGAVAILRSVTDKGQPFSRSVVISKDGSSIESLSGLKGKDFAFASLMSTSGNMIPRYLLAGAGIHLDDLRQYKNFDYHDSVVKRVLRGEFEGGSVREVVAEKYLPLGIKIIASSEPIPTGPVVIGPKTPFAVVETVKEALLRLKTSESGKAVLGRLDPELQGGFVETRDADYAGVRKLFNDIPTACGLGCHPNKQL